MDDLETVWVEFWMDGRPRSLDAIYASTFVTDTDDLLQRDPCDQRPRSTSLLPDHPKVSQLTPTPHLQPKTPRPA